MPLAWVHAFPTALAAFLASFVEFVEALTVILAVGSTRGWRGALGGTAVAIAVLVALVPVLGSALTQVPLRTLQAVVGTLLLLFGLRWLRKAVLRAAGIIPLRDEATAFAKESAAMRQRGRGQAWDRIALATTFQITMLEGIEVVFIVVASGAGGGLLWPASLGAIAALLGVALLGAVIHRPLARVPENSLKFVVGVLLSGFGCFWAGEGMGITWPGGDWSILALVGGFFAVALGGTAWCRARMAAPAGVV